MQEATMRPRQEQACMCGKPRTHEVLNRMGVVWGIFCEEDAQRLVDFLNRASAPAPRAPLEAVVLEGLKADEEGGRIAP